MPMLYRQHRLQYSTAVLDAAWRFVGFSLLREYDAEKINAIVALNEETKSHRRLEPANQYQSTSVTGTFASDGHLTDTAASETTSTLADMSPAI